MSTPPLYIDASMKNPPYDTSPFQSDRRPMFRGLYADGPKIAWGVISPSTGTDPNLNAFNRPSLENQG
jgi:hypothetical protein